MSIHDRRRLAYAFVRGEAATTWGEARTMPTRIKSGRAASLNRGVAHLVSDSAIVTDPTGAVLVARWECDSHSVNAVPVPADGGDYATCAHCAVAARYPRGPVVYRCYSDEDDLLYIGSSINVRQRMRAHAMPGGSDWWAVVGRVECESFDTEAACRLAEADAIRREHPLFNRDNKADTG